MDGLSWMRMIGWIGWMLGLCWLWLAGWLVRNTGWVRVVYIPEQRHRLWKSKSKAEAD